ncbi:M20 family metallopeptidase [Aquibacillus koreensis]|uniref:M20 family metallopeptidase n=1 Tax=Aquibacillus koreensis TaxID=279446 RepID=A0A9X4AHI1_9BACI|nr:M20 family metallopeptidase [Aquibacillus koreensis]MCT2535573.1 M20 family metallopeptidase [Aquibacillus koreensis]MDC3420142.1 M20 family metallopeptidase [Aquibacillus koreensis]
MWADILKSIDSLFEETVEIRRYLHQYPELSFQEEKTAKFIAEQYEKLDIPYQTNVGGNGVIATLTGAKPGKTVGLRADFDALPIQDEKNVSYKSKIDGVMHACGHDAHTATLLTIAKALKAYQSDLKGTVVFIHQHAEELAPGGAKSIVESGALDNLDAVFGTHLWSNTPYGTVQTSPKEFMAGADRFSITIQGKGGHGAMPQQTNDAIVIGSQLVSNLQHIISRRVDPLDTAVLTIGTFQAGTTFNIIADKATITGTVRTFDPNLQDRIIDEMEKITKGTCTSYDATYSFDYEKGYPPVVNHPEQAALVLRAAAEVDGVQKAEEVLPSMTGEDFSYYLLKKPGAFFFTGAQKEGHVYPHHHPKFDIDERAMIIAAKTLINTVKLYQK